MNSMGEISRGIVAAALEEDLGSGDWTTVWTVPREVVASARVIAKGHGVLAGVEVAREVFRQVDDSVVVETLREDGQAVAPGDEVIRLRGAARSLLSGERVALNFLQRLSGVATLTRRFVDAVHGTGVRILDTRKTTPGLRLLEKAAVRAGGGVNHRAGLYDMVLIKENHIAAAGGIAAAVESVRRQNDRGLRVEIEARSLDEAAEAARPGVDVILLDNMTPAQLCEAVLLIRRTGLPIETEASGGVDLGTVRGIAESGVDAISVGALTHSAPALDLSLLIDG